MNDMINIGLIGAGQMGRNHLRVLKNLKNFNLRFVFDINLEEEVIDNINFINQHESLHKALNDIDAVVICSPTSTHLEMYELCSKYVKNIFVEKPLVSEISESNIIKKIINKEKINTQVGFIERYNPAVEVLKEYLNSDPSWVNITFERTNKLSNRIKDVDVISDLMIHDIDLALYLNGSVKNIKAQGIAQNKMVGFVNAIIEHENGKLSNIIASRITDKKIRSIQITAENYYIDCNLLNKEVVVHKNVGLKAVIDKPYVINNQISNIEVLPREALQEELIVFGDTCLGHDRNQPSWKDNHLALEVSEEIRKQIV